MPDKQPAPLITPQMLRDWQACYTDDSILELYNGRPHLTPLEICELRDVSVLNRLWVVMRPAIIPESELHQLGLRIAQDAAVDAAARQVTDAALAVKRQWLAGCADDAALLAAHADVSRAAESAWQASQRDAAALAAWRRYLAVRFTLGTDAFRASFLVAQAVLRSGISIGVAYHWLDATRTVLARLYHEPNRMPGVL